MADNDSALENAGVLVDPSQAIPDPNVLQNQLTQTWQQKLATMPPGQRIYGQLQAAAAMAPGANPAIQQAQRDRAQMLSIVSQVNGDAPDNEDPLAYQQRLSKAILQGFGSSNPQVAMAAAQNLTRLSNAQQMRQLLTADVSTAQSNAAASAAKAQEAQRAAAISGTTPSNLYFIDPQNPGKVLGRVSQTNPDGSPMDPTQFAQQLTGMQQQFPNAQVMTDDQYSRYAGVTAQMKMQATLQAAQIRALAMTQSAAIRAQAQGQQMDGRQQQMVYRVLAGAEMAGGALENVSNMEFGATTGFLGTGFGSHAGGSLMDGARDSLRNSLSTQEQQQYVTYAQPIWRGISAIEQQGGLQGGQQLAQQVREGLELHPGDTALTIMGKLAQVRQDIENGTKLQLANPKLDPVLRDQVQQAVARVQQSVPFTVADVQAFQKAQEKNPRLTYRQWAAQNQIGDANTTANPPGPSSGGTPNSGLNLSQERADALAALKSGKNEQMVRARYKQRTGQDL